MEKTFRNDASVRTKFTEWLMFNTQYPEDDIVFKFRRMINSDVNWPDQADCDALHSYVETRYAEVDGAMFAFNVARADYAKWLLTK